MGKFIDLAGKKFNRLTVIERAYVCKGEIYWHCICDCGKEKFVSGRKLRENKTKSCGCYKYETHKERLSKHKLSNTKLYRLYRSMYCRCYCEKSEHYSNYGGRGITICNEWLNDFKFFYDWAYKNGYKEELLPSGINKWTIDRIDNDKGYSPDNCRFVTMKEQCLNRSTTVKLTYKGITLTRKEWAKKVGIKETTIKRRMYNGWSIEEALSIPANTSNKIKVIRRKKENN